jgi:hypothetical protein
MESLLPPLQGPAISAPDLSLTTFMDQRGDQLKKYVDESIKMHIRSYDKSTAPSFPSCESNTEPPTPSTSTTNGSPLAQTSYGMPMHVTGPSKHHLRQSSYIVDRPAYFVGPSDPTQARTQITQVAPCMVGSFEYNPGQFGPVADHSIPYVGPSGYVADRLIPYTGPFGYGMNRPAYYAGPSDSTQVVTHVSKGQSWVHSICVP